MNTFSHAIPGLILKSHRFELPVDYAKPLAEKISVFAREVVAPGKEHAELPYLVFFQGGPGSGAPRPTGNSGWIKRALKEFRVLLLDQRGTGASTPITAQTLRHRSPEMQADYLQHFRADTIVRDAEAIRKTLIGDKPWSILGQSFGGFCAMNYLSAAPDGLKEVLITGGIPSLTRPTDDVYRATYPRVLAKNRSYYERYPDDVERVRDIVQHLTDHEVQLPRGGWLTAQRFLQLGLSLGMSDGYEAIHYLIEDAFVDRPLLAEGSAREMSWNFLANLEHAQNFDSNPIYSLLQEVCYTQQASSDWSAERLIHEFPQFDRGADGPIMFTGEMVYPWMFDQYPQLQALKTAANLLARKSDWPMLYDVDRLRENRVPVAAAVYYDDMYVHRQFSEETAQIVPNMKLWVTSEYEHNGLRADGEAVLNRLLKMARGEL